MAHDNNKGYLHDQVGEAISYGYGILMEGLKVENNSLQAP